MFLLDCFIQSRFTQKWKTINNNVEISSAAPPMQDALGNIMPGKGDFTESVVRNLKGLAKGIDTTYKKWRALHSIPEILAKDKNMYSNPQRPAWFDKTEYEAETVISRGKICPVLTRRATQAGNRQLVFVRERIQDSGLVKWPAPVMEQIEEAERRGYKEAVIYNEANMPPARPSGEVKPLEDGDSLDEDDDEAVDLGYHGRDGLFVDSDESDSN